MPTLIKAAVILMITMSAASAQEIRYERIFPMIADDNNRLVITVSADNQVTVERPEFMTDAGVHRFTMDGSTRAGLDMELSALNVSSENLEQRIATRSENELVYVSDREITVIRVIDENRNVVQEVWAEGLQPRAEAFPRDTELRMLADFENGMWDLMSDLMTNRKTSRE